MHSPFAVINGEKAAFNVPVFAQKRQRTLEMLIKNLYEVHMADALKARSTDILSSVTMNDDLNLSSAFIPN